MTAFAHRDADPPPGFRPWLIESGFVTHNGPVFVSQSDGNLVFGARVMPHHCNPMGVCHGGWIATLMDIVLPLTGRLRGDGLATNFLLTVNLSIDYLGAARLGDWVEGRGEILRQTGRMVFVQGRLDVAGDIRARGSGIFRRGPEAPPLEFAS